MTAVKPSASPARRMGPRNSATRHAMLDAAERIILDEGFAALTARRVAEVAGFKHQLVYYYFHTMDDLIMAAFHRLADTTMGRLEAAVNSPRPLHALWEMYAGINARLAVELTAYSARRESIRTEIVQNFETSHAMQEPVLERILDANGVDKSVCPPVVAVMLFRSLTQFLEREAAFGNTRGAAEMRAFIEWCLNRLEPAAEEPKQAGA